MKTKITAAIPGRPVTIQGKDLSRQTFEEWVMQSPQIEHRSAFS